MLAADRDPILIDASERGELLVAKIRLGLSLGLLLIPIVGLFFELLPGERLMGLATTGIAVAVSFAVYLAVRRRRGWPYLGLVTACVDVTLVSGALAAYLVADQPHTAVNSRVTFEAYFIAIGATCLRYDRRACVAADRKSTRLNSSH